MGNSGQSLSPVLVKLTDVVTSTDPLYNCVDFMICDSDYIICF